MERYVCNVTCTNAFFQACAKSAFSIGLQIWKILFNKNHNLFGVFCQVARLDFAGRAASFKGSHPQGLTLSQPADVSGYTLPAAGRVWDLHPLDSAHRAHPQKNRPSHCGLADLQYIEKQLALQREMLPPEMIRSTREGTAPAKENRRREASRFPCSARRSKGSPLLRPAEGRWPPRLQS